MRSVFVLLPGEVGRCLEIVRIVEMHIYKLDEAD